MLVGLGLGSRESYESWLASGATSSPVASLAGADRRRRRARPVEGGEGAVARRRRTALHGARAAQRDRQAARAPPPRMKARWWKVFDDARPPRRRGAGWKRSSPTTAPPTPQRWRSSSATRPRSSRICAGPPSTASGSAPTNLLERTFVEVRRRTKVIGRFPGETSALSLIWAVLELSSRGWRGVTMTPKTVAQIERMRRRQIPARPHRPRHQEVIAA